MGDRVERKAVIVNGIKKARTVFRIKTPWVRHIDLFHGPFRLS